MNYTIRASMSGYLQYFDVNFDDNGVLKTKSIRPSHSKIEDEISLDGCETIEEVMGAVNVKAFRDCVLWKIGGHEPGFYEKKDKYLGDIDEADDAFRLILVDFYNKNVVPLLPSKKFKKDIREYKNFETLNYLCYRFLYRFGMVKQNRFDSESNWNGNYIDQFERMANIERE